VKPFKEINPDKTTERLQKAFKNIVEQMIKLECPLPHDFKLYYCIKQHDDRQGSMINISPHLTQKSEEDREWKGKYGSKVRYTVVDSKNKVSLENCYTRNFRDCDADYKII
jgi:predicted amidohydrolase